MKEVRSEPPILTLANLVFQASALGLHFEGEIKGK